ncbi:HD domain-containing protein [Candidatus Parcubacteria bacterium]|nr:HD domain-containing protein [Candidatus Parcubacteria bacterium]
MDNSAYIAKARIFAKKAHGSQTRASGKTYTSDHCLRVAIQVRRYGGDTECIVAAFLHDVVEDTPVTIEEIRRKFGDDVGNLVLALTDSNEITNLPIAQRKQKQAEHIRLCDSRVKLVKVCDQLDNVESIINDNPGWDAERCLDYANGAMSIVNECQDVIPLSLWNRFRSVHSQVLQLYSGTHTEP